MKNKKNQTKTKEKGISKGEAVGIGVGIAAASVAAYILFGPNGKKNRKKVKGWAVKMKGEIIEKLEEAKDITESTFHETVDRVREKYENTKGVAKEDLDEVTREIKKHWKTMVKDLKPKQKVKLKVEAKKK